jgi:hypothetical protein
MQAHVWVEEKAVDRMAELDLSVEIIERVVRRAEAEVATCTPLDPPIMRGLTRWGRTTRFLREELIPLGWTYDNPRNLPRTIHPSRSFAIVATAGDELTGVVDLLPATKYPKGYATQLAVETNEQLTFDFGDFELPTVDGSSPAPAGILTWILLFHVREDGYQVELSLPDAMEDGRITNWAERIILPLFPFAPEPLQDRRDDDGPDDIVVEVSRR